MSEQAHILVIEDDMANRRGLVRALTRAGHKVEAFARADPALDYLREHRDVVLVITDLMMPGTDGFGVLTAVQEIRPRTGLLMITGHATVESAVDAMKQGADDYLTKPVNLDELRTRVANLIQKVRDRDRREELEERLYGKFVKLIGNSKAMQDLFRQMELVAGARSNVLIVGASGTGKELVANALHEHSPRHEARFLPINCAAIPAEILESELFGHEKGAFTGATARKVGKFELADGGTLFLDEIGELPLEMQVKLLRVLEQREFMRVGGTETIRVDIRLVAATNQDLETMVEQGRFRNDLYYRLKVVTLRIPPLSEREGDVRLLANHFLDEFAKENGRESMSFTPEAMAALVNARWVGNVRELRNLVESLVVLAPADEIRLSDLPEEYRDPGTSVGPAADAVKKDRQDRQTQTMEEIERRAILDALEKTGGNRTQAAELLGIGLRTLQRKIKDYRMAGKAEGH
ncbi:MAG: response regulator [Acidobacteria bacterium]|nr:response regulator [Acidobacteriota bacterium]NIM60245.1 response regulator [Acidobacteriota bacterium]NIO60283.1 response regulator [Acidobacteriota bacterium]NIQ31338.1 response regulator [Acidobacteriota bacterium]NIQ86561.1 response regulator [Acidobacteriota bacterium]